MIGTQEERIHRLKELYPVWEPQTLWTRFSLNTERYADEPFVIFEGNAYSYREIFQLAERYAGALIALGLRTGEHIAIQMKNSPDTVALIFAISKLACVRVPIHMCAGTDETVYILEKADCVFLISDRDILGEAVFQVPALRRIICRSSACTQEPARTVSWKAFQAASQQGGQLPTAAARQDPHAVSNILFTSGSTARAKGVMLTHDMILRSAFGTVQRRCMEEGRRILMATPLYHTMAYIEALLPALLVGGAVVMYDGRFEPQKVLALMEEQKVNDIVAVAVIMIDLLLAAHTRERTFPHLHAAYWASECPHWVWSNASAVFQITDITTGYGMTECSSTTTMTSPLDPLETVSRCHGKAKPGAEWGIGAPLTQLRICDPATGQEVPYGQSGELCCFGPCVTKGYYKEPELTSRAFDEQGWFHTGDICHMDAAGALVFERRSSDVYKINGENVSPQFIDSVISRCPAVKAVETVGVFHEKYGEIGVSFIDTFLPFEEVYDQIRTYCSAHLARFQIPRYFIASKMSSWPQTETGKIPKRRLRTYASQCLAEEADTHELWKGF